MDSGSPLVFTLASLWPYALIAILLAVLGIVTYLALVIRAARRSAMREAAGELPPASRPEAERETSAPDHLPSRPPADLRRSFAEAMAWLRAHVGGRHYRYQIPWFLLVGQAGAGKTTAVSHTGMNVLRGPWTDLQGGRQPTCGWWFFDRGIVLDIGGAAVLGADGRSADMQGWQTLLHLLQRFRPQRPIDGVVLTIPCTELLGPPHRNAERLTAAAAKADRLYEKLWQAQTYLGMRLPIYVLVTKCDLIQGFTSFCREIPTHLHDAIFGWSNPYRLEAIYAPTWVDEAFENLHRELYQIQVEILAEQPLRQGGDALFLFPAAFQALAEPLRLYLDRLFRASAYHEAFLWRGVYFCGDSDGDEIGTLASGFPPDDAKEEGAQPSSGASPPAAALSRQRRPMFLRHLFERKIFPEYALARPVAKTRRSRNRTVVITQSLLAAVALIGGVGLWAASHRLAADQATLFPVLNDIARDLREFDEAHDQNKPMDTVDLQDHAEALLHGMADIRTSRLISIFLPSSWFSPIHRHIIQAITLAYDRIILKDMTFNFEKKVNDILTAVRNFPIRDRSDFDSYYLWRIPEFLDLQGFVTDVEELEKHITLYNNLPTSKNLRDIGKIHKYLFGIELPEDFYRHAEYYHQALGGVKYTVPTAPIRDKMTAKLQSLVERLYERLFEDNAVLVRVREVAYKTERISRDGRPGGHGTADLRELYEAIEATQSLLANPAFAWLAAERFDLGETFDQLLQRVQQSALLGPAARVEMQKSGERAWRDLRADLAQQATTLTGPILQRQDGKLQLQLSTEVLALKGSLGKFVEARGIGRDGEREGSRLLGQRLRIIWDAKVLEEAVKVYQRYDNDLKSVPPEFEPTIAPVVLRHVEANMNALIAQAQDGRLSPDAAARARSEDNLRAEMASFKSAVPLLRELLGIFTQRELLTSAHHLADLVASQASTLLAALDQVLMADQLYGVREGSFAWWNGHQPAAYAAYDVRNAAELAQYVELQRDRLRYLARQYAEPLISFLTQEVVQRYQPPTRSLLKWQAILAALDKYDGKQPGNSVALLEKFILGDLLEITPDNCLQRLSPQEPFEPAGDFFLQIRNHLRHELSRQCQALAEQEAIRAYTALGTLFNRRLAGRYPFADRGGSDSGGEASPEAIHAFFQLFDKQGGRSLDGLKNRAMLGPAVDDALTFLEQMTAVRTFFAPFLDGTGAPRLPAFDVAVEFRVNQAQEVGGNRIIDWAIEFGAQALRARDPERKGRWRFGDPVRVSLRWAKDSPVIPVADSGRPGPNVTDETVVYEYPNRWSLLRLLREHAVEDEVGASAAPPPLKFEVRTRPRPLGPASDVLPTAAESLTRVFIRVAVMSTEPQAPLALPVFPRSAPSLRQEARR